jgi:hypothetical protein
MTLGGGSMDGPDLSDLDLKVPGAASIAYSRMQADRAKKASRKNGRIVYYNGHSPRHNAYVHKCERCDWCYGPQHFLESPQCWAAIQKRHRERYRELLLKDRAMMLQAGERGIPTLLWHTVYRQIRPDVRWWRCPGCRQKIYWCGWWGQTLNHCPDCRRTALRRKKREALRQYRKSIRTEPSPVTCARCGTTFTPPRSDASYCSPACRQAAYRERKAAASTADGYGTQ